MPSKPSLSPHERALIRDEVRQILARSPAYRALPAEERGEFGASLGNAAEVLVEEELGSQEEPRFITQLIRGTFQAVVDASIQQMREYGELLGQVAASPDSFVRRRPEHSSIREALVAHLRTRPASTQHPRTRSLGRPTLVLRDEDDNDDDKLASSSTPGG